MFLAETKTKAMIACGRRCCLCHKFAGVGMECHHIVPQASGGDDSYENCIPLCFDCHAEVGHYNDKHPKGTKFSPEELRGHRDSWYAARQTGKMPAAPTGYEDIDRKLFSELYKALGGSSGMLHFLHHDYSGGYAIKIEHRLYDFLDKIVLPETEFFDEQMAASLADLRAAVLAYKKSAGNRIWHDGDTAHVPPEWQDGNEDHEKRFDEAVEVMNKAATEVWEAFAQFVKMARSRLKISPDEK